MKKIRKKYRKVFLAGRRMNETVNIMPFLIVKKIMGKLKIWAGDK